MFFSRGAGLKYIDRGDPDAYDKVKTDFTDDNTWRDLDLSAIVGSRKVLTVIHCYLQSPTIPAELSLRTKGNSNEFNVGRKDVLIINVPFRCEFCIETDANGFIQYKATDEVWTVLSLLVRGWFV